jgi:threonyl-tRNA synthetase
MAKIGIIYSSVWYTKKMIIGLQGSRFFLDPASNMAELAKYALQVREAQLAQFNYILVVGAKEAESGKV